MAEKDGGMKKDESYLAHFDTFLVTEKRVATNTHLAYRRDIVQLLTALHKNKITLETCTKEDLKKFVHSLNKNGITAKSISRKISSIKLFFNYLNEQFKVENKASVLIFPKLEQKLPVYLTDKEIKSLFKATSKDVTPKGIRNKVIIQLLYATGMRVSELTGLTVDQVHFDTGFVHLMGKGNKERMVPLPKATMQLLRIYLDTTYQKLLSKNAQTHKNVFFPTISRGAVKAISRQSVWNILKALLATAGISKNVSPHTLRHSLATHLLKNGANIRSLQMLLGHEQLTTVQIYTHLETSQLREVYDKKHPRA